MLYNKRVMEVWILNGRFPEPYCHIALFMTILYCSLKQDTACGSIVVKIHTFSTLTETKLWVVRKGV